MKTLVIFYSLDGNTRRIAQEIAGVSGADILELKPQKNISSKGLMKYFWGGRAAMTKKEPELRPLDKNPADYDLLFIGTPVWAWTYAPALRTFFKTHILINKTIALFCCHGGSKGPVFKKMNAALQGNAIAGEIDFYDPLKHQTEEALRYSRKNRLQGKGLRNQRYQPAFGILSQDHRAGK